MTDGFFCAPWHPESQPLLLLPFMQRTYLGILWKMNKGLFVLACLFIAGLCVPLIIGFEITPFYDWKMYAFRLHPRNEYNTYVLRYNGREYNKPHTVTDYQRMMIMYTMPHYDMIRSTGDTLPFYTKTSYLALAAFRFNRRDTALQVTTADLNRYPKWLKRYTEQQTGERISSIEVDRITLVYRKDSHVTSIRSEKIIAK